MTMSNTPGGGFQRTPSSSKIHSIQPKAHFQRTTLRQTREIPVTVQSASRPVVCTSRAGRGAPPPGYLEQTLAPGQYTIPAHQPGAPRLRLLTFAVSVRGALGSEAQTFIRQLSALGSRALCAGLTGCLTRRAGPRRGVPLCSARRSPSRPAGRSLPASVGAPAPARRPPTLSAATISPPPTRRAASTARLTRLLLSSDLLRVAAWVAVGLCLGTGFAFVVGLLPPHSQPRALRHTTVLSNIMSL